MVFKVGKVHTVQPVGSLLVQTTQPIFENAALYCNVPEHAKHANKYFGEIVQLEPSKTYSYGITTSQTRVKMRSSLACEVNKYRLV